ncbi:hypothetical protein AB0P15_37955 [Streptomyces sp. NPDC087917]|uniref:hypothetical protein n=1 Tax=unclassified Streptomyces TaxID=2593676 RepID=UPI00341CE2D3
MTTSMTTESPRGRSTRLRARPHPEPLTGPSQALSKRAEHGLALFPAAWAAAGEDPCSPSARSKTRSHPDEVWWPTQAVPPVRLDAGGR